MTLEDINNREYKLIEDHFARVNTAVTRGTPEVKIGVIHPIESYWIYWGTEEKTSGIRRELEDGFQSVIEWLLYGLLDFDFISESLLPEQMEMKQIQNGKFPVGEMRYDAVVVPNCITLRKTTVERLEKLREQGDQVIFTGRLPQYMDAKKDSCPGEFASKCRQAPFCANEMLKLEAVNSEGKTNLIMTLFEHDSLLLYMEPSTENTDKMEVVQDESKACSLEGRVTADEICLIPESPMKYTLSEPNVCILDIAEYQLDEGDWNTREEILRIDNQFRDKLGYPKRLRRWKFESTAV